MSDDFAESFYAKMDKPEPAKNESPVAMAARAENPAAGRFSAPPVSAGQNFRQSRCGGS
jgi:hypothetical protein